MFAGLLKTNTIMFGEAGGRGLFPMFSLMNHSCRSDMSSSHIDFYLGSSSTQHDMTILKNNFPSVPMRSIRSTRRKSKIFVKIYYNLFELC